MPGARGISDGSKLMNSLEAQAVQCPTRYKRLAAMLLGRGSWKQEKARHDLPNEQQHGAWHILKDGHDFVKVLLGHDLHVAEVSRRHAAGEMHRGTDDGTLNQDLTEYQRVCKSMKWTLFAIKCYFQGQGAELIR